MEMTGEQLIPASRQQTWEALNDPEILKACVPGCESIERVSDTDYQVLMVARVGPVSAKFRGKLALSDLKPPDSYAIAFEGQGGAAGFGKGSARVTLADGKLEDGAAGTRLSYSVKASVGGKLAQIGSRLVDAAARKIAGDFFRAFNEKVAGLHGGSGPGGSGHGGPAEAHSAHEPHAPGPVPRDPDLPNVSNSTLGFLAAGALVVFIVALFTVLG